jgi:hypothetical protein
MLPLRAELGTARTRPMSRDQARLPQQVRVGLPRPANLPLVRLAVRPDQDAASVTVIVTKTPRNEPGMVRQAETARRRRLRPAWL